MRTSGKLLYALGLIAGILCHLDTAVAQTNPVVATPPSLTFNTENGVATQPQTVLLSTASGSANITVTAYSDTSWLKVSSSSATTPAVLTVSIGSGAPTSGVDVGYINVLAGGSNLSIPVTLNANSNGAPSTITASSNSLSFVFPPGDTAAQSQSITLSSSSSAVTNFVATPLTYDGSTWLSVSPTAGSLPSTLLVTVNPVNLQAFPGTFDAAVAINAPGTNGISIPIVVTIQGTPSLTVSPSQLSFEYQLGTASPVAQTLTLSSSTGVNVPFTANAQNITGNCGNWIVLSQNTGATPSTLTVQVNTSGLAAGPCSGQINISAPAASNSSITVPVSLLVSSSPLIQVPSTGATFNYQIGGAVPAAQTVQITSSTSGLPINAAATPNNNGPNFLQISPSTGTTSQALTLSLNPTVLATLGPGTYSETVSLTSANAGNSPQTFTVTLNVTSNPTLSANTQALNFNYQVGQTAPPSQTLTITSSGAPLNYQVAATTTNCPGFLSASSQTGSTYGTQNQVVVSVNPQNITPQVCNGDVTLTIPGSTAAPLVIPVTLNVSSSPLLSVSVSAINVVVLAGSGAMTQTVSVTTTDGSAMGFTATAVTNPPGLSWLSVVPNSGSTPSNLTVGINPANLGVGVYPGSIVVSSTTAVVPSQTIPVTLTVVSSTAAASQPSLTFTQAAGGTAPNTQSLQITGVPAGTTIGAIATTLSGTGWLSAAVAGNTVTVTANGSQLAQGSYSGVITVIVPGAGASPLYVPVTLNVTAATSAIAVSANSVSFNVATGSTSVPTAQTVQVTSTTSGTSAPFTATFVPSTGGNFLTVTPSSGSTPATLTLAVNPAVASTLSAATYTGAVQVASGNGAVQVIQVSLVVSAAGTPVILSVNSAASFQPGAVSPGEIVTIFGNSIGPATPATGTAFTPTSSGTVSTSLAGVTVTFNGVAAPLLFVSPSQINLVVPYEVAGQTSVPVIVKVNNTTSATMTVPVAATAPAIFSLTENGSGQGAILNQDASINGTNNAAAPGSIISIYATGEGVLTPAGTTGCISGGTLPLPKPVGALSLTIGGQPVTDIEYAGEAPDSVCGLLQINATIPASVAAGAQPIVLTIGTATNTNQSITVAVK